ncbi:sorbitol dehydrogenase family protein [Rouxiella badensis]|uniref:sorbitol dehydrogenase family protein n=1 Tax=Rouxiella badensis TaxID=1646377 RepID=UPI001D138147|nr:sorbitol dehydrogenase family protein [Rouxiella badensis]MCC3742559.1 sorbitol dehydrogenase family protein [Rouxiella badensis]
MLTRRQLLISGAYLTGFAALNPALSWAVPPAQNSDTATFYPLSLLLTARTQLSQVVAQRALNYLSAEDNQFPAKLQQLVQALSAANITHADQLNGHAIMAANGTGATARKVISAWYLGFTGTPIAMRAVDNTRFVTYTDALMYAPTIDATVIPTYSRGHTNYWTQPPATIKND